MIPAGGLREAFALDPDVCFLNNGSFGATPRDVLAAQDRWRDRMERQPVAFLVDELPGLLRTALDRLAPSLGATRDTLAFVPNATSGMAALLGSLPLGPMDVIALTDHGYNAVWEFGRTLTARTGARVVVIPVPFPVTGPDEVLDAVTRAWPPGTTVAVFDQITSPTGIVFPVAELVKLAHARGALALVDGAHVPGHVPVDLAALGADGWVGNLHKWQYAPRSAALLHVPVGREVHPPVISHDWELGLHPAFHWPGTFDPTPWLAAADARAWAEGIGVSHIQAWTRALRSEAVAILCEAWGVRPAAPESMLGAMGTVALPFFAEGTRQSAAAMRLAVWQRHRIEVPFVPFGGRLWVRISAQLFNRPADYHRLAGIIGPDGIR